ncbi:hypothetical protein HZC07_01560, partial [Candidatus Micrarchaeota archaeon]|nr:hypothetical protein [Candidatus Micrarchaeota archaeon]
MEIGLIASIIEIVGYVPYTYSILKQKTVPSKVSWGIWTLLHALILVSYYAVGARATLWINIANLLRGLTIFLLALKYGEGGTSSFDKKCLLGAFLGILIWIAFNSAAIALYAFLAVDIIAYLPTMRKMYYNPENEDKRAFVIFFIADTLNLLAID